MKSTPQLHVVYVVVIMMKFRIFHFPPRNGFRDSKPAEYFDDFDESDHDEEGQDEVPPQYGQRGSGDNPFGNNFAQVSRLLKEMTSRKFEHFFDPFLPVWLFVTN